MPLVRASADPVPTRPCRRRPAKLRPDNGYDHADLRRRLRGRNIIPRIARRGIETSNRLDRHRWVVERTVSWTNGFRRMHRRAANARPGTSWPSSSSPPPSSPTATSPIEAASYTFTPPDLRPVGVRGLRDPDTDDDLL
ncbi:hypothetical protein H4W34_006738 [Actinomadura algeriensis]|uniref:DDE family transposase n=1 Tax=Actinomadura algeriensis TaxID=1679523 RepID=A0ABR9K227_9ACTN|nr:hypothetical protein [Actinomadura algeriensis]